MTFKLHKSKFKTESYVIIAILNFELLPEIDIN